MTKTKTLLIVAHMPSTNLRRLAEAMLASVAALELDTLTCTLKPALETVPEDVLAADGVILLTPENLGYMSGGMKDFFDRCYYPCLELKQGLGVAALIRAGHDGTGTCRAMQSICTGLKWRWAQEPLLCRGEWQETFISQAEELACAMALGVDMGIV